MPSNGPKHDVSPSKNSFPDKKKGESFNEPANKPNKQKKDLSIFEDSYNTNYAYDRD